MGKAKDEAPVFELEPKGKRLTVAQKVERNLGIVRRLAEGATVPEVAEEFEVCQRTVRYVRAAFRESNPTLRHHDPIEIVDELLEGYAADLATLARTQREAEARGNFNGVVGAINSKTTIRQKIAELCQAIGALPHDLGTLRLIVDGRILSERIVTVLEAHELPQEVWDDLERELAAATEGAGVEALPETT